MISRINSLAIWKTLQVQGIIVINVVKQAGKWTEREGTLKMVGESFVPCDDPRSKAVSQPIKVYKR